MAEDQNIEYKEAWRDEYLKWICWFANAQGGRIFIGMEDNGEVCEHRAYFLPWRVSLSEWKHKQELKSAALHRFLLQKIGVSWEQQIVPTATLDDIDEDAVRRFLQKAVSNKRISAHAASSDTFSLLKNLELLNDKGEFLLAALLLFGKRPQKNAPAAYFKIGRFGRSYSDLLFQDIVEGNILDMADSVIEILNRKYLIRPISYEGLLRKEPLEYPERALRGTITAQLFSFAFMIINLRSGTRENYRIR